ncbi:hypothetical protein HOY82DRAFT_305336 [Tuber indicum]|nr:hypothetical protein HOY82DRAFT_305336 [Tuber indicum]
MEEEEELPPPSYPAATGKDPLPLIAPYVAKRDLYSASLVCKSWHREFSEHLWQRPEVFWNLGDRSALTNFSSKRISPYTSPPSSGPPLRAPQRT